MSNEKTNDRDKEEQSIAAPDPELEPEPESPSPICPNWSNILMGPTTCLKAGCTKWIPIHDPEVRKECGVDGFCADSLNTSYIEDLALSIGVIAEIMSNPNNPEDYGQVLEDSRKEKIVGYV